MSSAGPFDLETMFEAGNLMIEEMASAADYFFSALRSPASKAPELMPLNVVGAVVQPAAITATAPAVRPQEWKAQKTVRACQAQWRALRIANQRTTTEKAYVAGCRAGDAGAQTTPTPTAAQPSFQKSVEACQEEWRAMRAANERTTTEKAYVAQCRAAATATSPALTGLPASPSGPAENIPTPAPSPADPAPSRRRIIQR